MPSVATPTSLGMADCYLALCRAGQRRWTPTHTEQHLDSSTVQGLPRNWVAMALGAVFPNHSQHFHILPQSPHPVGKKGMPPL